MEQDSLASQLGVQISDPITSTDLYEANPQDNLDGQEFRRPERDYQTTLALRVMRCPSSPHNPFVHFSHNSLENLMRGNYVGCFGGGNYASSAAYGGTARESGVFNLARVNKWPAATRLGVGRGTRITAIQDGTSNTVMYSEVLPFTDPLDAASSSSPAGTNQDGRGAVLFPGPGGNTFVTFTAPNSTTMDRMYYCDTRIPAGNLDRLACERVDQNSTTDGNLWAAARSKHTGGVNVCMADGSVRFVRDGISLQAWQAAGTKSGGETLSLD
jgi:prepilin-type processing-associated H-X9-DG protein